MLARMGARIEAARPAPWIFVRRDTNADRDRSGVDVTVVDVPAVWALWIATAGEFGHAPLKRGPRGLANRPMGWALEWSDTPPIGAVEKGPETSGESGSLLIF